MKIQIYSYYHIPYGSIPIVSVEWMKVLLAAGHDVKVKDYFYQDYRFPEVKDFIGEHDGRRKDTLAIYFGSPSYQRNVGYLVSKHKYKIGVFVTETELSRHEKEALANVSWHKVAVPSSYCKNLYGPHVRPGEVMVVPHGFHPKFLECNEDVPRRENFTFLYVFNTSLTGGSLIRKNLGNLLTAFKSFRAKRNASLYIKSSSNIEADVSVIERDNPGVKFDFTLYSPQELARIYKSCHAYVNASRAEGFGMTVLEAMACGLPVASPNHSGLADFVNTGNAVVIASNKSKEKFTYATNDGYLWDVPVNDIEAAMHRLYDENEVLTKLAKENAPNIKNQYSWANCLKEFTSWVGSLPR